MRERLIKASLSLMFLLLSVTYAFATCQAQATCTDATTIECNGEVGCTSGGGSDPWVRCDDGDTKKCSDRNDPTIF